MSMTNETSKPKCRTRRIWALLLSLPLWLPLLACTAFEWFVDPFPNSIWLLRVLNTKYLVHVRADLTIDGEPLVMERTFRCFDPVDYDFLSTFSNAGKVFKNEQAGDSISARAINGRLFAITLPDVCETYSNYLLRKRNFAQDARQDMLSLKNNDIMAPRVFELSAGIPAKKIDVYYSTAMLRKNLNGVVLNDLSLREPPPDKSRYFFDWGNIEWFGPTYWARPHSGYATYITGFAIRIPVADWGALAHFNPDQRLLAEQNPEYLLRLNKQISRLLALQTDTVISENDDAALLFRYNPDEIFLDIRKFRNVTGVDTLPKNVDIGASSRLPCPAAASSGIYVCNVLSAGMMTYMLLPSEVQPALGWAVVIEDSKYRVEKPEAILFKASDKSVYLFRIVTTSMGGR